MIYVFDNTQTMGECCGCPVGAQSFLSLSVEKDLRSDWAVTVFGTPNSGLIDIVSAPPNATTSSCSAAHGCNFGCDPTSTPGYVPARRLKGYILHNQVLPAGNLSVPGIPEVALETANPEENSETLPYLQQQCRAVAEDVGGGVRGTCDCGAGILIPSAVKASSTK